MKYNLQDVAFLLVARFDTIARLENALCVTKFLCSNFNSHICLWEFENHYNGIFKRLKPRSLDYQFHKDNDPILYRTHYINKMLCNTNEKFVAVWDIDVIVPVSQILKSVRMLREGADFVFPYEHHFCETSEELRNMYIEHTNLDLFVKFQKFMNELYAPNPVGGAFLANRESYVESGGENEDFYGWGLEDGERYCRWDAQKRKIQRVEGPLFHLTHSRGSNSLITNNDEYIMKKRILLKSIRRTKWKDE